MADYVAIVGENVADVLMGSTRVGDGTAQLRVFSGGGPANTAVALGRLGTPTKFISRLTKGVLGELFVERLRNSGIDLSLSVIADEPATLALASVAADGNARYDFYAAGTADWQWRPDELSRLQLDGAACVHAGSLGLVMQPGGPMVEELLAKAREHATISIDPNVRTAIANVEMYRKRIWRWTELADVFRLSEDDLVELFPDSQLDRLFDSWHEAGTSLIVLTRGDRNAVVSFQGKRLEVPTPSVSVVDTIGAGDAFTAGMLHWIFQTSHGGGRLNDLDEDQVFKAVSFGSHVAALSCSLPGANPPRIEQLTREALAKLTV
jgi:fructokinase